MEDNVQENKTILLAKGIKKTFEKPVPTEILKGIDFRVDEGEFVAILGESGSGKSTLLYCLAGMETPTEGSVEICGKDITKMTDDEMAKMRRTYFTFVYQFHNLVPNLTCYENVILPLALDGQKESQYKEYVQEIMDYLNITKRANSLPRECSGGEQQRVAIARAIVCNPKLVFLDEPTGALDSQRGQEVMEMLKKLNEERKVALVMVTHSPAHAEYATRIVRVKDGKVDDSETSV
ncbi:MAG: ABC transporter ATP-binding protein [Clostridia bacterium]|nr:ABC transporter ATP-binding protein [Clostridia bacterium]